MAKKGYRRSGLEESFARVFSLVNKQHDQPTREHRFDSERQWRFDFAWPRYLVAVEIEGGIFGRGRHSRGAAYTKDCEKYNAATCAGWKVLRYTTKDIEDRPVQCAEEVCWRLGVVPVATTPNP